MTMKTLLSVTAVVEAGAGLALFGAPSVTALLLFANHLDSPAAVGLARVGGLAILAFAIVCWQGASDWHSPLARNLIAAMLFYNFAVSGVLAYASLGDGVQGILLWPAV